MSEERQTQEPGNVLDQTSRANQGEDVEVVSGDDVIADLRRQLAEFTERDRQREEEARRDRELRRQAEQARRQAEERAAQTDHQARTEVEQAHRSTIDVQLDSVTNTIAAKKAEQESLKGRYASAFAEGDATKLADIQVDMSRIAAEVSQLESGKAALEARKQTPTAPGRDAQQGSQPSEYEKQEQFIRQQPARVQDWLRTNRDRYFGDPAFQRKAAAAASYATEVEGIDPQSEAFVEFVEMRLGMRETPRQEAREEPKPPTRDDASGAASGQGNGRMIAAPAAGSAPGTGSRSPTQIYLSAAEKEAADFMGVTHSEYARNKRDLQNEGLIGPNARRG